MIYPWLNDCFFTSSELVFQLHVFFFIYRDFGEDLRSNILLTIAFDLVVFGSYFLYECMLKNILIYL